MLFADGGTNGEGELQAKEILGLVTRAGLRITDELVLRLFLEADVNQGGVVEYDE